MKYKMLKGVRAGFEVIRPGTVLDKLPAGWDKDRLLRIGAIECLPQAEPMTQGPEDLTPPAPPPPVIEEAVIMEKPQPKAPAKKPAARKKPTGTKAPTMKKPAAKPEKSEPAGPQLPDGIDPALVAAEE